jgi:signal peptidase
MKTVSKIFKIVFKILAIIVGIFLLLSIDAWMQVNLFRKNYASIFGYSIFNVVTGSMSGTIEINDYVIVKNTDDVQINDIITFTSSGELITHRLVQISGGNYITRGDANTADDYSIAKKDIVGKVVLVLPKAGIWKNVISEPPVLGAIFVTLLLFTLVFSTEEKKFKTTTYKGDLEALKKKKHEKKKVSRTMKIGFLYNKQKEIEAEKNAKEEARKNRMKLQESTPIEKKEVEPEPIKQPKKIKANLEALKK